MIYQLLTSATNIFPNLICFSISFCFFSVIRHFREYIDPDSLHLRPVNISDSNGGAAPTSTGPGDGAPSNSDQASRLIPVTTNEGSHLHPATAALLGLRATRQQYQSPSSAILNEAEEESENPDASDVEALSEEQGKKKREKGNAKSASDVLKELPITPGALDKNLGIPIAVVVTKVSDG